MKKCVWTCKQQEDMYFKIDIYKKIENYKRWGDEWTNLLLHKQINILKLYRIINRK